MRRQEANNILLRMLDADPECRPISVEQWRRKGVWVKLSDSYGNRYHDPSVTKCAHAMSMVHCLFTSVSWLYLFLNHYIPENYSHYDDVTRYLIKVVACYIFVQCSANFLCVLFFQSSVDALKDGYAKGLSKKFIEKADVCGAADCLGDGNKESFSAKLCIRCQMYVPFRAHHCKICQKCIIRRDHHCFFTASCIGHYNQRYFVVLCFYVAIGCIWGVSELLPYMGKTLGSTADTWDYALPVTCFRWLSGQVAFSQLLVVWQLYNLWWMGVAAGGFFVWSVFLIALGKTSHEVRSRVKIRSVAPLSQRFRLVFGDFWLTSFLFPSVLIFRQHHDGIKWTDLRRG